jgi:hypothetical protein
MYLKQTLNSVVIFRDCSGVCSSRADAMRFDSPQPSAAARFNRGCGWEPGMRSLTNAPIVVAGVVVGGPLAGRANCSLARVGNTLRPNGNRASRFPFLEGESSLEGLFDFRPTKEDTHASRVVPTSPAKAADRLGRQVSSRRSLPCPRGARGVALGLRFGAARFAGLRRGGGALL